MTWRDPPSILSFSYGASLAPDMYSIFHSNANCFGCSTLWYSSISNLGYETDIGALAPWTNDRSFVLNVMNGSVFNENYIFAENHGLRLLTKCVF